MQERLSPKQGRPRGAKTFNPESALAFGAVVRAQRLALGISQEQLANASLVERSHMGKIERGEHMPNLVLILRIAAALRVKPGLLVNEVADQLDLAAKR